ncbi:hypothetical protein AKJ37_04510 [candidate division MSBL1 archaeon SCGC-AAA259I09]|uniref:molybdopterin molybdotransferase n=3 Tax=candidate division MSBL1 TaxID=215777 RepID=A0A133UUD0_9EURY|nr:hypothetical protein AKJ61_01995 [candidate division MSBL1 archaeon SCGC-AAA259B11]KXA96755.1 hypothetical protein AKJ37_04510 [candidate division MSBL1 archaeon SCGC-AAA259I09]KXA97818.1 hypothetical protein AKJ38_00030 [candidate division MSBL1 archaeon SCGC-AAA259I14]
MDFMKKPLTVKTLEEAKSEFSKYWEPSVKKEMISIDDAAGRVLAESVESKIDLPPFDRSVYDGFAVKAEDTFGAEEDDPEELVLKGAIHAGEKPKVRVDEGTCVEIATGALLPEGANAVVMVEDTTEIDENIQIRRAVSPGENISKKGTEIQEGEIIAEEKQKITPQIHGALSAVGIQEVKVVKKPHIAVISTGEELIEPNQELGPGQIYDVNGKTICDAVNLCGCEASYLGIVKDDISKIKKLIKNALTSYEVVITSGGSSAGSKDIVPEVIDSLGKPGVIVHGLAQKPGKPTVVSVIDGKPVFGLPGYPVSALMVFDQLVAPYLREMTAVSESDKKDVQAKLSRKILSARGRRELSPVKVFEKEGELVAQPLLKGSGAITSLVKADGYIEISLGREILEKNELVKVRLFGEDSFD